MPKGVGRRMGRSYVPTLASFNIDYEANKLVPPKGSENLPPCEYVRKPHVLVDGIGRNLPEAYRRFFLELHQQPSPVHYIPKEEKFFIDPETGKTRRTVNFEIPLIFPKEFHNGLWGGCGIVHGFRKKKRYSNLDPMYWVPLLKLSVVYSEILNKYFKAVVTDRTIQLINEHFGFDHYLLQTPACDLRANLALKLKRKMLLTLDKQELPHESSEKRMEVYNTYKHYLEKYDSEYIKWYGLTVEEAVMKLEKEQEETAGKPVPLKMKLRQEFLEELRSGKVDEDDQEDSDKRSRFGALLSKINPWRSKQD